MMQEGLPQLLGSSRPPTAPAEPSPRHPGDQFWSSKFVGDVPLSRRSSRRPGTSGRPATSGNRPGTNGSFAPPQCSLMSSRSLGAQDCVQELMTRLEDELDMQALKDSKPSFERLRIFSSIFGEAVDRLPSYRPLLLAVQKEYDRFVAMMQEERTCTASLQGRLRTMKSESLAFVGESIGWFQQEIGQLRKRLLDSNAENGEFRTKQNKLERDNSRLKEQCAADRSQAKESHEQNQDMLAHIRRLQDSLDQLRGNEQEIQSNVATLRAEVKEKEKRISSVEKQLAAETAVNADRVDPQIHANVLRQRRDFEQQVKDVEERLKKEKENYAGMVETYLKHIGQSDQGASLMSQPRPLTPRPDWYRCRGLLDAEDRHTHVKAVMAQEFCEHLFAGYRQLLSAYGMSAASGKSKTYREYALPKPKDKLIVDRDTGTPTSEAERPPTSLSTSLSSVRKSKRLVATSTSLRDDDETVDMLKVSPFCPADDANDWIFIDPAARMPEVFRELCSGVGQVRNHRFSRRKVVDFMDALLKSRMRNARQADAFTKPFADFVLDNLPEDILKGETEAGAEFAINLFHATCFYASEPDFLAYQLLLLGQISDTVVRDNKDLISEILGIFSKNFDSGDGTANITKQKLFNGLREVIHKPQDVWQEVVNYFPAGRGDIVLNYDALLLDDIYVMSPIVYALRLQHLDEVIALTDRMKTVVSTIAEDNVVTYEHVEKVFGPDPDFGVMTEEDYTRVFECVAKGTTLTPDSEQTVQRFMILMKSSELYKKLFFPELVDDDQSVSDNMDGDL